MAAGSIFSLLLWGLIAIAAPGPLVFEHEKIGGGGERANLPLSLSLVFFLPCIPRVFLDGDPGRMEVLFSWVVCD